LLVADWRLLAEAFSSPATSNGQPATTSAAIIAGVNILLMTLGSHGDVHPFLGIGLALRDRGHSITFATNAYFQPLATRLGFTEFHPLGTAEEYRSLAGSDDLWHRRKGFRVIFDSVSKGLPVLYDIAADFAQAHSDAVIVSSSLCLGARVAQDKLKFPMATIHLAPALFRSCIDPPKLPGVFMPSWIPRPIKAGMFWFGDRIAVDPVVCPKLNAFRASRGLAPIRRPLNIWWHSPDRVIGLWPEWFAPIQADWPAQTRLGGFPLYDEKGLDPLPTKLIDFLAAGEKPIAFTPGSAMWRGDSFFSASADACRILGRRGILLSRHSDHIPANLPPGIIHIEYAPFSQLLPHVAAIVHHGGIGTTSQGLKAGVPQLVMAMSHDQPDNVNRLRRLGVGAAIARESYRGPAIAKALSRLIHQKSRKVADPSRADLAMKIRFRGSPN
jgi:UDP:flavonoid glycosyltransferase YjiC (YdhE family)